MIACQDLRTGNIIVVNNRMRKVSAIANSNPLTDRSFVGVESTASGDAETFGVEDIYPVPLTDAILQQCNFTFHNYFKFWQLVNAGPPRLEMDIDLDYNLIDFMRRPVVKRLASLHQLQNIYYMLHGRELDFDVDTVAGAKPKKTLVAKN